MITVSQRAFAVWLLPCVTAAAADHSWPLDALKSRQLSVHGHVTTAAGVSKNCLVLDGASLLKVKDSTNFTSHESGFTFIAWVNPYRLSRQQQMIAAKNRYSLGERQWGVMIDKDNRFRLYLWQGNWATAGSQTTPQPGHWHQIGVVVRPAGAELWVNGRREATVQLTKAIPRTKAPLTLGGIDDNGRIWQNLTGALDDVRLLDSPLSAEEMAAAYQPVTSTHELPVSTSLIWDDSAELPTAGKAEVLTDVQFHVIKRWEPDVDGYRWLHGVALAWHHGKLYASFGHNQGAENTVTEAGRYSVSSDGGRTWSRIRTMDAGTESADLAVSHGVFVSHGDTLWALLGAFHNTRQKVHTRAYTLNEATGEWRPQGVVIGDGFWPMTEPVKMKDGNWILPGFVVGNGNPAAVAISEGDDLTTWRRVVIRPTKGLGRMWGESSVIVDGPHVTNIARYGAKAQALLATSDDFGRTWSPMMESNLPMATSKPCAGMLSTAQRYLICTTTADSGGRRSPLTIAVSRPGEHTLSKVFVIRHAKFPEGPGESHESARLSYPYATEHDGKLYVGYSNSGPRGGNHNSAELAVIPVEKLRTKQR